MRAAMILCAGLGTRLRPLTDWLAKPMVPIGALPAVGHIAARLGASGWSRLVVNVHHRPADLRAWAAGAGAAISEEVELLGTAGGVARATSLLGEGDVLVWNGDILSDLDPRARAGADFIGVHVLGAGLRTKLPERGCLVGDVYISALREGAYLASHVVTTSFVDVGSVEAYVAANRSWLAARGASSWAAPDAIVGADIDGSIVGAGARIDAAALRCIVWPGVHVRERVEDAIVTPHGIVRARG